MRDEGRARLAVNRALNNMPPDADPHIPTPEPVRELMSEADALSAIANTPEPPAVGQVTAHLRLKSAALIARLTAVLDTPLDDKVRRRLLGQLQTAQKIHDDAALLDTKLAEPAATAVAQEHFAIQRAHTEAILGLIGLSRQALTPPRSVTIDVAPAELTTGG